MSVRPSQTTDRLDDRPTLAATHDTHDRVVAIRKGRTQYGLKTPFDIGAREIGCLVVVLLIRREDVSCGVRLYHARVSLVVSVGNVAATSDDRH